ncbi:MAG: non-ribosomal peptide synthetase, partial [Clostridia bacterium]|nr:non-ribosomal peptide synthetase [Clostridia bacterium]
KGKVNAKYSIENGRKHETAGFFATCDLASEEDGYYTILGRSDDLIVLSDGENINPDEAEKVFKDAGAESVCLVKKGAGAVLVAEVKRFAPPGEAAALKERLAKAAGASNLRGRLSDIVITDVKLIADGDFKVSRTKIRRLLEEGAITDISGKYSVKSVDGGPEGTDGDAGGNGEADAVNDALTVKVIELMCAATGAEPSEVRPYSDFFRDLGGTSLDYFQLVSDLEREFGAGFPAGRDGEGITTAEGFARYLKEAGV